MSKTTNPELLALVAQVKTEGGALIGSPATLSRICAFLGFKNRCEKGRVFITDAKRRYLGLA